MNTLMRPAGLLTKLYREFPLRPRRTRLYGVGDAKTGTHSIATMFADHLRSRHEPEAGRTVNLIFAIARGEVSQEELHRVLLERDRRLRLEVDSTTLNYYFLDALVALFPEARFVLTVRHPASWLDSFINQTLGRPVSPDGYWGQLREFRRIHHFRFSPDSAAHPPEEEVLKSHGLFTLDAYLSGWTTHNRTVVERVPAERLLVVRTDEITARAADIARFAGVPPAFANLAKSREYQAKVKTGIVAQLDPAYLDTKIREHCGDLVDRFFPPSPAAQHPGSAGARNAAGRDPARGANAT